MLETQLPAQADPFDEANVLGGKRLAGGTVSVSGFKHSLVTVFAACLALDAEVAIDDCPDIDETRVLARLVNSLGGRARYASATLHLDPRGMANPILDRDEAERVHGSLYLVPALLARFGRAQLLGGRGGCQIGGGTGGARPVRHYVQVLERFGAREVRDGDGGLSMTISSGLRPCTIDLLDFCADPHARTGPHYSGASKMAVLAAAMTEGTSYLSNLYPKSDVRDLLDFVARAGAEICDDGSGTVSIRGGVVGASLPVRFTLTPDLIEIVTYAAAAALLCEDRLTLRMNSAERALAGLHPELDALERLGVKVAGDGQEVTVDRCAPARPGEFVSRSTGLYSDSLPFLLLLALTAPGSSRLVDTVWRDRFGYVRELHAIGASCRELGPGDWSVRGPWSPTRAQQPLCATDLRGAAALLLASLAVDGPTRIKGLRHLARGYPDLVGRLVGLGARIDVDGGSAR